jgi:hypothetical protein
MSLVVIISTAMLLYQFWTGALAGEDRDAVGEFEAQRSPDLRRAA